MRGPLQVQDIEEMRRRAGIEDVELPQAIHVLRVGALVKITLLAGAPAAAGETLLVRITGIRGAPPAVSWPIGRPRPACRGCGPDVRSPSPGLTSTPCPGCGPTGTGKGYPAPSPPGSSCRGSGTTSG
jgi:hypothetical protein